MQSDKQIEEMALEYFKEVNPHMKDDEYFHSAKNSMTIRAVIHGAKTARDHYEELAINKYLDVIQCTKCGSINEDKFCWCCTHEQTLCNKRKFEKQNEIMKEALIKAKRTFKNCVPNAAAYDTDVILTEALKQCEELEVGK